MIEPRYSTSLSTGIVSWVLVLFSRTITEPSMNSFLPMMMTYGAFDFSARANWLANLSRAEHMMDKYLLALEHLNELEASVLCFLAELYVEGKGFCELSDGFHCSFFLEEYFHSYRRIVFFSGRFSAKGHHI